jgi:hypothetical protein
MQRLSSLPRILRTARFPLLLPRRTHTIAMDYDAILQGKYPAKRHAQRVVEYIRSKVGNASGVLYLESRMTKLLEDNDEPEPFR